MSHEQKFAVNMNQIAMIKLALYLDDNEMSKMISLGQDYTLVNSNANMYIVEYYKNLLKRLERELESACNYYSIMATSVNKIIYDKDFMLHFYCKHQDIARAMLSYKEITND